MPKKVHFVTSVKATHPQILFHYLPIAFSVLFPGHHTSRHSLKSWPGMVLSVSPPFQLPPRKRQDI